MEGAVDLPVGPVVRDGSNRYLLVGGRTIAPVPSGDLLTDVDLEVIASVVGSPVVFVRRIDSGQSATTDVLERTDDGAGMVVRRHGSWSIGIDDAITAREEAVLRAARAAGVPVPYVIWSGAIGGRPTLITELASGTAVLQPHDPLGWAARLADTLAAIHAITVGDDLERILLEAPPSPIDMVDIPTVLNHPSGKRLLARRGGLVPPATANPVLTHGDYTRATCCGRTTQSRQSSTGRPLAAATRCAMSPTAPRNCDTSDSEMRRMPSWRRIAEGQATSSPRSPTGRRLRSAGPSRTSNRSSHPGMAWATRSHCTRYGNAKRG